ncbi:VanZ family protein [Heliorestis acidaminivorans]|uniref:VanZ family protein n=1 Tax=Heliorestis acidaminivorans TaxID=553427 RepID=A0A6I0EST6_9FIRM|nr:VanZ family protein [Heliorestis acidaminivorans]KAB2953665.1 VanZ family protein [Heliorestis acidaminivorans]
MKNATPPVSEKKFLNIVTIMSWILLFLWLVTLVYTSTQSGFRVVSGDRERFFDKVYQLETTQWALRQAEKVGLTEHRAKALFGKMYKKPVEKVEVELIVRKIGHFTVYLILGFLLRFTIGRLTAGKVSAPIAVGMAVAISDELIQTFERTRSGLVEDVVVDTAGVLLGVLMAHLLIKLIWHRVRKKLFVDREAKPSQAQSS